MLPKQSREMTVRGIAEVKCDIRNRRPRVRERFQGGTHSESGQVTMDRAPCFTLESPAQIKSGTIYSRGYIA